MLLCGIINELEKFKVYRLSYFFCQATEARLRSAIAVVRGLIYTLVVQQPSLISHVREKYDHAGKQLFEDINAWTALSKILKAILDDPDLKDAVLIIDALDECTEELPRLLDLIKEISSFSSSFSSSPAPTSSGLCQVATGLALRMNLTMLSRRSGYASS